jgi:hypothetical protein
VELAQAFGLTEEPLQLRRDEREQKRSEATGRGEWWQSWSFVALVPAQAEAGNLNRDYVR